MGWIVAAGALPAQACSLSSHCHAVALQNNMATNHGMFGIVNAACLHNDNDGNFANQEMWDASSDGNSWEEVGLKSGTAFDGTYYSNKTWFWADARPGQVYAEHEPNVASGSTNTGYQIEITSAGTNTYSIYGGNSFTLIGTSRNQTAVLVSGQAGTEYTSAGADLRDAGNVSTLERESTGNVFATWGSATQDNTGYITGSYGSAKESWSFSC
jgi:hypothetical protein